jgi:hypothetical protein
MRKVVPKRQDDCVSGHWFRDNVYKIYDGIMTTFEKKLSFEDLTIFWYEVTEKYTTRLLPFTQQLHFDTITFGE